MRLRYTVYNTALRRYLESASMPDGDPRAIVTKWTGHPERALRFPGVKSALGMVARLGNYSEFVVKNERGEIVG